MTSTCLSLLIHRGREQDGKGWNLRDKGTGSWRAGYGKREVLTPIPAEFTCTGCRAVLVLPMPSTVVTAMPSTAHNGSKQPFAEKCLMSVKVGILAVLLVLNRTVLPYESTSTFYLAQ